MNFDLTDNQRLLQASIFESASRIDHSMTFMDRWRAVAQTGIMGICVPAEYGGSGLDAIEMVLALEALARGNNDNGLSFAVAAHTLSCVIPVAKFGTAEQKERYLRGMTDGSVIAANAMTESESGSDVFNMQCRAVKQGSGYVINGTKIFISNNADASVVLGYAATDPAKGFFGGITAFLFNDKNFASGSQFKKMGLESCSFGEIVFNESKVGASDVLGNEGSGGIIFNHSMEWERICLTGIHLGAMQRVMDQTVAFVRQRKSMGQSIGKFQGVSHAVAEMQTTLEVARSYAYRVAWLLDKQKNISKEAAMVKLFVSNAVKGFMLQAMQLFGGNGYVADYGIEKEVRDALAATIYSGTSEVQKNIIASNLGL